MARVDSWPVSVFEGHHEDKVFDDTVIAGGFRRAVHTLERWRADVRFERACHDHHADVGQLE